MGHQYPSRRRAKSRPEDDFLPSEPYQPYQQPYDPYDPYQQYAPRNSFPAEPRSPAARSPPRRHKSERRRRAPSPYYHSDDAPEPSRGHGQRHSRPDQDRRGRSAGPDRQARGPSQPPLAPDQDPSRRYPRSSRHERDLRQEQDSQQERDPRQERNRRHEQDFRRERDPRLVDPYDDQGFYSREPPPRHYPSDPREPSSRDRPRHSRTEPRPPPSEPRARGRSSRHLDDDDDDYNTTRRRRPRSQTRGRHDRAPSGPSPTRGRPPPTQRTRDAPARRSSMPATTKARSQWWQNPLLQAGARTALTAGAQAAMKSRNEQGPWMGTKGAKIATAALGAALVDGFIGQKHPDSMRQNFAREGVDLATGKVGSGSRHHRR